eukprot:CAMPEP_0184549816 /NCGR_PEP_ID=MMETSP0199_2-20130426/12321_1 /TAXON_ID=1112570 /ORGANISM="Thraustochytrium sp., Strain LLF1b" /LENGTH=44 /DNA_ID= /DNA_START= /DNA_END= /DNA_ORIENTATION=
MKLVQSGGLSAVVQSYNNDLDLLLALEQLVPQRQHKTHGAVTLL